jgi:hypothetical protein
VLISLTFIFFAAISGNIEPAKPTIKIGTFDSRVVALAYFRSEEYQLAMTEFHKKYQMAKVEKNDSLIKALEKEGPWTQIRMHQQVFSNAGTSNILSKIADALPGIAREAGVVLIVSKWEMPYLDSSVEVVDVTLPIAKLFKPNEQTLKIIEQMKNQEPIPFDKLPLDPAM